MKAIKIKDKNKLISYVYIYLRYNSSVKDRDKFINNLIKDLGESKYVGYAVFP